MGQDDPSAWIEENDSGKKSFPSGNHGQHVGFSRSIRVRGVEADETLGLLQLGGGLLQTFIELAGSHLGDDQAFFEEAIGAILQGALAQNGKRREKRQETKADRQRHPRPEAQVEDPLPQGCYNI